MTPLYTTLLVLHIAAGFTGLLAAPVALALRLGSADHKRWGNVYVAGMVGVFATALPMSVLKPNLFLALVGVLSVYLAVTGKRIVALKKRVRANQSPTVFDWALVVAVGLTGAALVGLAVLSYAQEDLGPIVYIAGVFGLLSLRLSLRDARLLRSPDRLKANWLKQHLTQMLAGYIATVTAFSAVNLVFLPLTVRWLWPTVVGSLLIAYFQRRYSAKRNPQNAPSAP